MLDLNIPWPAQSFADAQRASIALRQQQQQQQQQQQRTQPFAGSSSNSGAGGAGHAQGGDDQPPLSKKARKKLQKQQQQQAQPLVQSSTSAQNASASTASPASEGGAPALPEWNALDELPSPDQLRLRLLTVSLASMGYKTCAYNHTFSQPTRFDPARHGNPFSALSAAATAASSGRVGKAKDSAPSAVPRRSIASVPFPELDPRIRRANLQSIKGKEKAADTLQAANDALAIDPSALDPGSARPQALRIVQLHRLTLPLDDTSCSSAAGQGHGLVANAGPALQSYDLLAVAPTTEAAFSLACLSLSELKPFGIDIISLDLGSQPRLPFWVKRSLVKTALQLGVVFEIAYSGALPVPASSSSSGSSSSAEMVRRNLISSTRALLLLTKGTNVILSSGARDAMQLRAPMDVINLFGAILGMGEGAARQAIGAGAEAVIRRARARKEVWRGIVGEARIRKQPVGPSAPPPAAGLQNAGQAGAADTNDRAPDRTQAAAASQPSGAAKKRKRGLAEVG